MLLKYGKDWLKGEHIIWNLDEETGTVDGGLAYFSDSQFYAMGEHIAKVGPGEYELRDGFITTCDPSNSDWKIRYKELNVDITSSAWAKHTSFWIRKVPFFYFPFLILPIQLTRQSGFLMPWAGTSTLNGAQIEIPFYWAIRQDMDATFYARYMEKRGVMGGLEYRIAHDTWGDGIWLFNYLRDQADKEDLRDEDFPFQKKDRYWLRSRHSFELPGDIQGRLDLDFASDKNYLREFGSGSTSFDESDKLFREFSGRGILSDETILARESALYLEKLSESSSLSMDVRYWDQLERTLEDGTFQRLPALAYNVVPTWVEDRPFYFSFNSSFVNYWRREGDRDNRLDIRPHVYYPLHWGNYLNVEPSVGFRGTAYWVDWEGDRFDSSQGNLFPDFSVSLNTRLNRVYPVSFGKYVAVEHAIRPEIVYEYAPEGLHTDEVPLIDRDDRDQFRHDIRYGFSTFLTAKRVEEDPEGNVKNTYQELARLQVFEAFNIDAPLLPPDPRFNVVQGEGFSDIGLRLDLTPKRFLTLSYDTDYSPDEGDFTLQSLFMTLRSNQGHALRLDYQFRKDTFIDELIASIDFKVLPNVFLTTYHDYSLDQEEFFRQKYGFRYEHGCWALGVAYEHKDNDHRVAFSVNLLGLGGIKPTHGFKTTEDTTDFTAIP